MNHRMNVISNKAFKSPETDYLLKEYFACLNRRHVSGENLMLQFVFRNVFPDIIAWHCTNHKS